MPNQYKFKTPKGAQHMARAASFKRIAKEIRSSVNRKPGTDALFVTARQLSRIFDDEAKLLRSMR